MRDEYDIFKSAIDTFGKTEQMVVAIEEMSELTKELTKFLRGKGNDDHLLEEMVDVNICFNQLMIIHNIDGLKFYDKYEEKLNRLEGLLKEAKGS